MRQDENMPILLKTQVESADKTPVTVCRARVGGLCRFRSAAERVPIQQQKTRRDIAGYQIIRSKRADPSHFEDPHGLVHGFAVHDNRLSTCAVIYQH